jgi:hypothetical protein
LDDLFEDVEIMEMRVKCFSEGVWSVSNG